MYKFENSRSQQKFNQDTMNASDNDGKLKNRIAKHALISQIDRQRNMSTNLKTLKQAITVNDKKHVVKSDS